MQQRFCLLRFPVDEGGPGQQRAYRTARGSAQRDDLVVGHHVGPQQPTQDAGGEGGMTAPPWQAMATRIGSTCSFTSTPSCDVGRAAHFDLAEGTGESTVITPPRPSDCAQGDSELTGKAANLRSTKQRTARMPGRSGGI